MRSTQPKRAPRTSLEVVAYHEAGHAVAGWRLGIKLRREGITIEPDHENGVLGSVSHCGHVGRSVEYDLSNRNRIRVEQAVQSLMAGGIAQRRFRPRSVNRDQWYSDEHEMVNLLYRFTENDKEVQAWFRLLRIRTENMFANPDVWRAVERLAAALLERRTIPGPEAEEIIREGYRERLYAEHPEMRQVNKELREHFAALAERDKQERLAKRAQKLAEPVPEAKPF